MKYTLAVISLVMGFMAFSALAAEEAAPGRHALMSPEEIEIKTKAKKRLYPGGQDEESLKVQAQLPQITRKMSPMTENVEETSEPAEEY